MALRISEPLVDRAQLLGLARQALRDHGLPAGGAEDLVQDAYVAWCTADAVRDPGAWIAGAIRNLARVQARRAGGLRLADPLDGPHLSLSEPWARGGS